MLANRNIYINIENGTYRALRKYGCGSNSGKKYLHEKQTAKTKIENWSESSVPFLQISRAGRDPSSEGHGGEGGSGGHVLSTEGRGRECGSNIVTGGVLRARTRWHGEQMEYSVTGGY